MIKIGFIDYYLDEYHALSYPKCLNEASNGEIQVCYAWAQSESPLKNAKTNRMVADELGIKLLDNIEAVIEKSDCLIVLSPDNPEMHEELCQLPLRSKKLTYVDKTFAYDRETALRIMKIAEESGTPFFSTSSLRFSEEYLTVDKKNIDFIAAKGPGNFENYLIHHLEPIVCLMGHEVEKIMYIGTPDTPCIVLQFSRGRYATITMMGRKCPFGMAINYKGDTAKIIEDAGDFNSPFIAKLVDFFKTGDVKVRSEETLQIITVLEYGHKAKKAPGIWIDIPKAEI